MEPFVNFVTTTHQGLDVPYMLSIVPEIQQAAAGCQVVNKTTAGAWASPQYRDALRSMPDVNTVIVAGVETDYCVLATVLSLIDKGYAVILATDTMCSSQPNSAHAALDYTFRRRSEQIRYFTVAELVQMLKK